jgi:hypothetical protein
VSHDPREVLEAVRRLEAGLDEIRVRTSGTQAVVTPSIEAAISEQRALVEDLELVVELVGNSWRATRDEVATIAAEIAELRRLADEARAALTDVRFELHLVRGDSSSDSNAA